MLNADNTVVSIEDITEKVGIKCNATPDGAEHRFYKIQIIIN